MPALDLRPGDVVRTTHPWGTRNQVHHRCASCNSLMSWPGADGISRCPKCPRVYSALSGGRAEVLT